MHVCVLKCFNFNMFHLLLVQTAAMDVGPEDPICPTHYRLLDFFCEKCNILMCATCAVNTPCGHKVRIYMYMQS